MDDLSLEYLTHREVERDPPTTLRARRRVLASLGNAGTATRGEVEAWWESRSDRSPATRTADLAMLRSFYKWAQLFEKRADDPTIRLKPPRLPNRVPRPARKADVKRLLDVLDPPLRRAVILGAYLGLRVSESARLDWADYDDGVFRIVGKGGKTRLVPVSDEILTMLDGPRSISVNVVTCDLDPFTPERLAQNLNRAMKRAGVDATSHQLRHLYGTTAYAVSGGDLLAVRDLMGHESTQTTAGYAKPSLDVARKIAEAMTGDSPED